jgi:hypothetical protein
MKCPRCGAPNRKEISFCTSCGAQLEARHGRRKIPGGGFTKKIAALVAGALVVALAIAIGHREGAQGVVEPGASAAFGVEVRQVASRFWCSCGNCETPELADCSCPRAVEEKKLIDQELQQGTAELEVVRTVHRRYGGIKSQYASLVQEEGTGAALDGGAAALPARVGTNDSGAALPAGGVPVAVEADTLAIAGRFTCACGQCGELALADCDCDHPRGAREMKAFIAYQISRQRHTADEIVQSVSYEYGHLRKQTADRRSVYNRE